MRTIKFFSVILAGALLFAGAGQAKAGVIFSNLGPGNSFNSTAGSVVDGSNFGNEVFAEQFTPGVTSTFQDAIVAIGYLQTAGSHVIVSLETDVGGSPGSILEQITVSTTTIFDPGSLVTATSVLQPTLSAGTPYWLVLSAAGANDSLGWELNSIGDVVVTGNLQANEVGSLTGPWLKLDDGELRNAFQIDGGGTVVPEPGSLTVLSLGLAGIGALSWMKRRKVEVAA